MWEELWMEGEDPTHYLGHMISGRGHRRSLGFERPWAEKREGYSQQDGVRLLYEQWNLSDLQENYHIHKIRLSFLQKMFKRLSFWLWPRAHAKQQDSGSKGKYEGLNCRKLKETWVASTLPVTGPGHGGLA